MDFRNPGTSIYVPDGSAATAALSRTTHLAVGAHQDDIPIMAYDGILRCFGSSDQWFLGVTVTDGAGSPRTGRYSDHTDEQMRATRAAEERKAASLGQYTAAIQLDYSSAATRARDTDAVVTELAAIMAAARPRVAYTHNLADKHDSHVAVALRTIRAIRSLPENERPVALYGCEVWRDLDWMIDSDKVLFDVTSQGDLSAALIRAYDSQISGGKRYELATEGRRRAHATFGDSRQVDSAQAVIIGMDLTPLIVGPALDPEAYVAAHVDRLRQDISARIRRLT